MSTRGKPAFDAAKRESGARVIKGFDKGVLKQIADVVSVPPENRDAFYRDLYWLLRVLVEHPALPNNYQQDRRARRGEVLKRLDALIVALEALIDDEDPAIAAAGILFAGEPTGSLWDFFGSGYHGQRNLGELLKNARLAKEIALTTKMLRGRGTPQGTRGAPSLDYFLLEFFRATVTGAARRTTAFKDRATGSAKGSIVEVLLLVAPYLDKGFLPRGRNRDATILYAIRRAQKAAKRTRNRGNTVTCTTNIPPEDPVNYFGA
jgi:hypothetical protein